MTEAPAAGAAALPLLLTMPPLHPRILDGALISGAGLGVVLAERYVPAEPGGAVWRRVLGSLDELDAALDAWEG